MIINYNNINKIYNIPFPNDLEECCDKWIRQS